MAKPPRRAIKAGDKAGKGTKVRKRKAMAKPKAARKGSLGGLTTGRRSRKPAIPVSRTKRRSPKAFRASSTPVIAARKNAPAIRATPAPERPPRLLRNSRGTAAALNLLEKAIRLIHHKNFRRARAELDALIENHRTEVEIVAKARSYCQICEREERAARKPASPEDQVYTLGIIEHNRGNYDGAITHFRQTLLRSPDADYVYYSMAASYVLKGETGQALEHLRKAIQLNEANRFYARNDPDFNSLHENREFADLVGMVQVRSEPLI
ncbi:MAG: hypothetical protein HXY20_07130 [Acidobacteria bacterium]|nr:hypothetical protein [Acidobacteriota bacterium]